MPGTEEISIQRLQTAHREALKDIIEGVSIFYPQEVDCAMEVIDGSLVADSTYVAYVAMQGERVLGYVCYGATPLTDAVFDMYWLVVDHACQGQGIGRQLMEFMERQLHGRARMIMIETSSRPPYERARRLYKSMDYPLVATIQDFYAVGDDKLIFGKKVS